MNDVVARLLTDLTASMRFTGQLNTDLNEITTNLVPFPRLHYLVPSLAPMATKATNTHGGSRGMNSTVQLKALFRDCFGPDCCLVSTGPKTIRDSTVIASGIFVRGKGVPVSDVNSNVARLQSELKMPSWNREGFKIGLCEVSALEQNVSMMTLNNSDVINTTFGSLATRFTKLWRRKAMVHHYLQYCEEAEFTESIESLEGVMHEYATVGQRGGGGGGGGGEEGGGGASRGEGMIWDVNSQAEDKRVSAADRTVAF